MPDSFSTQPDRARAEALNQEGMVISLKYNDFEKALGKFNAAIAADPDFVEAYTNKGNCHRFLGEIDEALVTYTHAISRDPDYLQAYLNRAYVYLEKNDPTLSALAVQDYMYVVENGGHYLFASTLEYRGMESIIPILKPRLEMLGLYPPPPEEKPPFDDDEMLALIAAGDEASVKGHLYDAIYHYSRVTRQSDEFTSVYLKRGLLYLRIQRIDRAIVDFTRVLRHDPDNIEAYARRAEALAHMGKHEAAVQNYDEAIARRSDREWLYMARAEQLVLLEDYEGAIRDFQAALECNMDSTLAYYRLGFTLTLQDDYESAVEAYSAALLIEPDMPEARIGRVLAHETLGNYAAAITDLEYYRELDDKELTPAEINSHIARLQKLV